MPHDGTITDFAPTVAEPSLSPAGIVLLKAAQIIRERGLITTVYYTSSSGKVCGVCAIAIAENSLPDVWDLGPHNWGDAVRAARTGMAGQLLTQHIGQKIDDWVKNKTTEEVATAMEAAAYATVEA